MEYSFDIKIAEKYGVEEAIMIKNFQFWITKNKANNKHFYDNHTWTYNSIEAFKKLFKFWTGNQIRRILKSLINHQIIITGNYNKHKYDRTNWYAFKHESIFIFSQMENEKNKNANEENNEPIPDINTNNKPINIYIPILTKWNSRNELISHSETTFFRRILKKHVEQIETHGIDNVLQAIDNYADIISDSAGKYFFTHSAWTLWDFIFRGLDRFVPSARPKIKFLNKDYVEKKIALGEKGHIKGYKYD